LFVSFGWDQTDMRVFSRLLPGALTLRGIHQITICLEYILIGCFDVLWRPVLRQDFSIIGPEAS